MTDATASILVIDDDKTVRQTLSMALQEEGYVVDEAADGKEAIEKTYAKYYNLAIVDWRLPDIEGTKLLDELSKTVPPMMKIMLTGYPSIDNAIDAVNKRFDAFFPKPVDFEKLLERIRELLREQEGARSFSEELMVRFIETRSEELLRNKGNTRTPK